MSRSIAFRIALGVALVALVAVPTALAGKGGGGGKRTGTLTLVLLDSPDTVANNGEQVTFQVATSATDAPFVGVKCWQGTTGVYNDSIGIFANYLFDPWLTLDSPYWQDGLDASCTARGYYYDRRGRQIEFATMDFTVAP